MRGWQAGTPTPFDPLPESATRLLRADFVTSRAHRSNPLFRIIAANDRSARTRGCSAKAAATHAQRPAHLHVEAAGLGSSSEADAAAAHPAARQASSCRRHRAAQARRSREDAAADPQQDAARQVRRAAVGRLRLRRAGRGAFPRQHVHAARHGRRGLPPHPDPDHEHRAARAAERDHRHDAHPRWARARDRPHGLGQVDDARGDDPRDRRQGAAAHRHDRGPDRVPVHRPSRRRSRSAKSAPTRRASRKRCATRCARIPT